MEVRNMWTEQIREMILNGILETLYMTVVSTLFGYVFGLPMGVLLCISDKDGLKPHPVLYKILDFIANIVRSVPFLILLILLIPFTRFLLGKSYGSTATIVPLKNRLQMISYTFAAISDNPLNAPMPCPVGMIA